MAKQRPFADWVALMTVVRGKSPQANSPVKAKLLATPAD
jgi:hypothetical protein